MQRVRGSARLNVEARDTAPQSKSGLRVSFKRTLWTAVLLFLVLVTNLAFADQEDSCEIILRPQLLTHLETDEASYQLNQHRSEEFKTTVGPVSKIRAATFNFNLVSNVFARNPIYQSSRVSTMIALKEYLSRPSSPDILFAQEVWEKEDHESILRIAAATGYEAVVLDDKQVRRTGLQILVRKSLNAVVEPFHFIRFQDEAGNHVQAFWENWGSIYRGLLYGDLVLSDGTRITLATTHMTPLTFYQRKRDRQLAALERLLPHLAARADGLVLAGDFNIAGDYKDAGGAEKQRVSRERKIYSDFFIRYGLIDTFRAVHRKKEEPGYTTNIHFPNTLALRIWPEVEKRIDYVFANELGGRIKIVVEDSRLIFTESNDLSDHFGVESELLFFRTRDKP